MEKAVFITAIDALKYAGNGYDRLYFGNEFCERLIPSLADLKKVLKYCQRKGLAFSFVTPYVTDDGLKKLERLFGLLKESAAEVIVNDWGPLHLLNGSYPQLTPVLGRLLTKQKRGGPKLEKLMKREGKIRVLQLPHQSDQKYILVQKKLPLDLDPYYRGCNTGSVPIIHDFLIQKGIRRIELDNLAQGLSLELPEGQISASVYWPYAYITTTLFCPSAGCDEKRKSILKVRPCRRECQQYVFLLRHKTMPKMIYLKGNTQFCKNRRRPFKEWKKLGVDRIVVEPRIPL